MAAMSKRKNPKSRFVLEEGDGIVIASLVDENDLSLKHVIQGMPHPKVRSPRRSKSQIEEDSNFMAAVHHTTQKEFLTKNIRAMTQEINNHVQEIRKSLKRMQSITHYVVTAQEVLNEMEKNT